MYRINEQNFLLWKVVSKSLTLYFLWWLQTANGDVISKRSEQRFAAPGEPECCVCGRFGAYICDEVWAWICSSFRFLQCFLLFVRPDPKKNYSLFDTWDTVVQHFYQFLGMLTLIVGIWWVAVKTEDDVCSLECKQEVLQLRAVQCAQASVRLANSGHHSHYYFTLLLNFLTETIHGSHSKWLHMHNIKWEWYIISRFLAHGRIVSDI